MCYSKELFNEVKESFPIKEDFYYLCDEQLKLEVNDDTQVSQCELKTN